MYHSQVPYQSSGPWPTTGYGQTHHSHSRKGSKHRTRSVETKSHRHASAQHDNQQQQQPATAVTTTAAEHHHHHRHHHHHHHRSQPTNVPSTTVTTGPYISVGNDANIPPV